MSGPLRRLEQHVNPLSHPFSAFKEAVRSTYHEVARTPFKDETYTNFFPFRLGGKTYPTDLFLSKKWETENDIPKYRKLFATVQMSSKNDALITEIKKLFKESITSEEGDAPVEVSISFESDSNDLSKCTSANPKTIFKQTIVNFFDASHKSNAQISINYPTTDQTVSIYLVRAWKGPKTCGSDIKGSVFIHMEKEDAALFSKISKIIQKTTNSTLKGRSPVVDCIELWYPGCYLSKTKKN